MPVDVQVEVVVHCALLVAPHPRNQPRSRRHTGRCQKQHQHPKLVCLQRQNVVHVVEVVAEPQRPHAVPALQRPQAVLELQRPVAAGVPAAQSTWRPAWCRSTSPHHQSPLQICSQYHAPVQSSVVQIYHEAPGLSCSPNRAPLATRNLVILTWLAQTENTQEHDPISTKGMGCGGNHKSVKLFLCSYRFLASSRW